MRRRINSQNHRGFGQERQKERGARQPHERLPYCFNVNRTSQDHLLLGRNADVDKNVECPEYIAGSVDRIIEKWFTSTPSWCFPANTVSGILAANEMFRVAIS
jgi:hypothetical protein